MSNSSTQCLLLSVLPLLKLLLPKVNTDQLIANFPSIESFDLSTAYHHNDCPISYSSMLLTDFLLWLHWHYSPLVLFCFLFC